MVLFFSAWLVVKNLSVSFIPSYNEVLVVGSPCVAAGGKGKVGCLVHLLASWLWQEGLSVAGGKGILGCHVRSPVWSQKGPFVIYL